ncbi:hypothetical protein KC19_11G145100 [Ceratodon purpureus]|uniref:Uncharacterized protein n=1 Tax=Ceratodon purpureus TaxID=3225 RepID=A0A8T0GF42_CERPU|nr:hypothetical protein KC19_N027600 [Ceratodon purpureus]KAG0557633.1 hypothetical protein KC19_11G145100 [Ceratodon purpureus]
MESSIWITPCFHFIHVFVGNLAAHVTVQQYLPSKCKVHHGNDPKPSSTLTMEYSNVILPRCQVIGEEICPVITPLLLKNINCRIRQEHVLEW